MPAADAIHSLLAPQVCGMEGIVANRYRLVKRFATGRINSLERTESGLFPRKLRNEIGAYRPFGLLRSDVVLAMLTRDALGEETCEK